jgi:hypothetical protein
MTPTQLANVLLAMATSCANRDGHPNADYAHYSLKFALIAGAEKCIEMAKEEVDR